MIKSFAPLTGIRQLYLSSNKIRKIRGLETLVNLEKLWLDGNLIYQLEGLATMTRLTELNLASNQIEQIGPALDLLKSLKEVNFSGNKIGSFKEVLHLARLNSLETCNFSDPNFGDNPICNLSNYQIFVLFHLPQLQRLDMKIVLEDDKILAEATFMKKKMYYNMRIKTIQRNTTNLVRILKICKSLRRKKLESQIGKLTRKL